MTTTALPPTAALVPASASASASAANRQARPTLATRRSWKSRLPHWLTGPAWPVTVPLIFYPVFWALGMATFIFPILAVVMVVKLRRMPRVLVPPGFWIYGLYTITSFVGLLAIPVNAPDTIKGQLTTNFFFYGLRGAQYLTAGVFLLYAGNLSEIDLPKRILAWSIAVLGIVAIVGGWIGLIVPNLQWTSPIEAIAISSRGTGDAGGLKPLVHPSFAQVQDVLAAGQSSARPTAPFEYTNSWGGNTAMLMVWIAIVFVVMGKIRNKLIGLAVLAAGMVPMILSLNRGAWFGIILAVAIVVIRMVTVGRFGALAGTIAAVLLGVVLVAASPLGQVISERSSAGHSNRIRSSLGTAALDGAIANPILGWGWQRTQLGSDQSIAIGVTSNCPQCGNRRIGSTGHVWTVMYSQGLVGLVLYVWFFVYMIFRYARDRTWYGLGALVTLSMSLLFSTVYPAASFPLVLAMLVIVFPWRNEQETHRAALEAARSARARMRRSRDGGDVVAIAGTEVGTP